MFSQGSTYTYRPGRPEDAFGRLNKTWAASGAARAEWGPEDDAAAADYNVDEDVGEDEDDGEYDCWDNSDDFYEDEVEDEHVNDSPPRDRWAGWRPGDYWREATPVERRQWREGR